MACREEQRMAGGAYPRSCLDCGLWGPCKKGHAYGIRVKPPKTPVSPPIDPDQLADIDLNALIEIYADEKTPAPFRVEVRKALKELRTRRQMVTE
jgi:hypothetical protein